MENQIIPIDQFYQKERITQMLTIADQFVKAGCFGKDVTNPQQAYVKIQAGAEIGMAPMESMNSLYIVNGHVTMWGSALAKRLRQHGWKIEFTEETENGVTVKISKGEEFYSYTVTKAELVKMNSRAFAFAPREKMRWHGLSRLVRFNVPEVLGNIQYTQEEAEDFKPEVLTAPVIADPAKAEAERIALMVKIQELLKKKGKEEAQIVKFYKVESVSDLSASDLPNVVAMLETLPDLQEQAVEAKVEQEVAKEPEEAKEPEKPKEKAKKAIGKDIAERMGKDAKDTFYND